mmetsp:Transcript_65820/g.105628  ORF Transcript_65820/g.105628 Transcript_65820/m.105628 type:complete len:100 (+) Transcript_65820:160-459(+)
MVFLTLTRQFLHQKVCSLKCISFHPKTPISAPKGELANCLHPKLHALSPQTLICEPKANCWPLGTTNALQGGMARTNRIQPHGVWDANHSGGMWRFPHM